MARKVISALTMALIPFGAPLAEGDYDARLRAAEAAAPLTAGDPRSQPRIVGGEVVNTARPEEWRHAASLQFDDQHFCGATLVAPRFAQTGDGDIVVTGWTSSASPRVAVTAAHCVVDGDGWLISTEFLTVKSGAISFDHPDTRSQKVLHIEAHPGYGPNEENDIALLVLGPPEGGDEAGEFADGKGRTLILPTLPQGEDYQLSNVPLDVLGWGRTAEGGQMSDDLRMVRVPFSDQADCEASYSKVGFALDTTGFCAGFRTGGFDSCQGDSGGGVVYRPRSPDGRLRPGPGILVGVVSWGEGCARYGLPGIYADTLQQVWFLNAAAARHWDLIDG